MTGYQYEQFVRAVLINRLSISVENLISTRTPGVKLPNTEKLEHQIDLMYFQDTEIAEYITIIECKYRKNEKVDQPEVQNLAYVKNSVRAHKAIMVTNTDFTTGAKSIAQSEKIALLIINPHIENLNLKKTDEVDQFFQAVQAHVRNKPQSYNMVVVQKLRSDPGDHGLDIIEQLLADPAVRQTVDQLLNQPEVRETAKKIIKDNPDIANKAMDFLKREKW